MKRSVQTWRILPSNKSPNKPRQVTHHLEHAAPADVAVVRPGRAGHAALLAKAVRAWVHDVPFNPIITRGPGLCARQRVRHTALLVVALVGTAALCCRCCCCCCRPLLVLRFLRLLLLLLLPLQPPRWGQHAGRVVKHDVKQEEDGPAAMQRPAPGAVPARVGGAEQGEEVAEEEEGDGPDEREGHYHEAGAEPAHEEVEEGGEAHL